MLRADVKYASAGCNQVPGALCCVPSHNACFYSAGPNIVVVETHETGTPAYVTAVLPTRRKARVSTLTAVDIGSKYGVLIFGALSDGSLAVARGMRNGDHEIMKWSAPLCSNSIFHGSTPVVSVAAVFSPRDATVYLASVGMDRELCLSALHVCNGAMETIFSCDDAIHEQDCFPLHVVHKIQLAMTNFLPECVTLALVHSKPLIALGGTDRIVRLYSQNADGELMHVGSLHGHRDWIRCLSFSSNYLASSDSSMRLVSGSTDGTLRVWRFTREKEAVTPSKLPASKLKSNEGIVSSNDLRDIHDFELEIDESAISRFTLNDVPWTSALEGVLSEHSGAVHTASFTQDQGRTTLLSSSMDGSIALWTCSRFQDYVSWNAVARFGILGGSGTFAIGFAGAAFASLDSSHVVGHSLGGSLHFWRRIDVIRNEQEQFGQGISFKFVEECAPAGHIGSVTCLAWAPTGRFLLTCSEDKTARIYAESADGTFMTEWARPQVHGHAIRAVAFLKTDGTAYVSASDEKVLRIFDAPGQFLIRDHPIPSKPSGQNAKESSDSSVAGHFSSANPTSAFVPELGLSNKPIFDSPAFSTVGEQFDNEPRRDYFCDNGEADARSSTVLDDAALSSFGAGRSSQYAPLDIDLRLRTMWPERAKLYGHGNDVNCIATSASLGIIASCSKAQNSRDADIIIWDATTGTELSRLSAHDLSVNQLCFSERGDALLSVSRDRSFAVFSRRLPVHDSMEDHLNFNLLGRRREAHGRLIHAGCWLFDAKVVATGSRDKYLKLFSVDMCPVQHHDAAHEKNSFAELHSIKFPSGVSALDAIRYSSDCSSYLLAVGLEDGSINCLLVVKYNDSPQKIVAKHCLIANHNRHCSGFVSKIMWRPLAGLTESDKILCDKGKEKPYDFFSFDLAVASEDRSVRILRVFKDSS